MTSAAGLLGSISMSFIKGVTEIFSNHGFQTGLQLYIYVVIAILIGVLQLTTLNRSMDLYDQVDTIPIY